MKRTTVFTAVIAFVLAVCTFFTQPTLQPVYAVTTQEKVYAKQYLSEVKMFYGQTEALARADCEKEGYIFCPTNLNEGAPGVFIVSGSSSRVPVGVYMGYKTTEDAGDAITDITLLDLKNTHFEEMNYQEFLDNHIADFKDQAGQMMVLVNELARKVKAGSPNAMMAYDSLNMFYVDEDKSHTAQENLLGYYLVHKADITFFEKFIQRGNSMVLGKITDLLCSAAADYNEDGTTWVDRARESEVAYEYENGTSETRNMYDENCQDPAKKLITAIKEFADTYKEAKKRYDTYGKTLGYEELEGMTEENSIEKLSEAGTDCRFPEFSEALGTYALLDEFPYQEKGETVVNNADLLSDNTEDKNASSDKYKSDVTLAQYIMKLANDETLEDHPSTVYPIIQALTQAQRIAFSLGGFSTIIEGLYQTDKYIAKREKALKETAQNLQEQGYKDGKVSLWVGTDSSIYSKKVVQTDAANEASASGVDLTNSVNEAERKEQDTLSQTLIIIDVCTLGFGGFVSVASAIIGSTLWTVGSNILAVAGLNLAAGLIGSAAAGYIIGGLLCAMWALNVLALVVGLAMLVYSILQWTGALEQREEIDYSNIPDVVFDARQNSSGTYSVRYDTVTSNASISVFSDNRSTALPKEAYERNKMLENIDPEHAEMNGYQSVYDRWMTMYYSKAPAAGKPIEVVEGEEPFVTNSNYQAPEGYRPLKLIIGGTAVNVNDVEIRDQKGSPLYVFFPGIEAGKTSGTISADDGKYITKVRLSHADNREDAINRLKSGSFQYYDVNLTPKQGYTFLGYQVGSEKNALTDIRLASCKDKSIVFGDASYAKMGEDDYETTPDGLTLYATASKSAGTPIVKLAIQNERLELGSGMEPVCLFSGGNAVDLGAMWSENILSTTNDDDAFFFLDRGFDNYQTSKKSEAYEFMSQKNPSEGYYLYFQPKEQFLAKDGKGKAQQRYVAGFSYFLAGDKKTADKTYGTNYEFMQTFAKENGFELLKENGEPMRVMTESAGEMTMSLTWRDVGGHSVDTYNFDQVHTLHGNNVIAEGDGGLIHATMKQRPYFAIKYLSRENEDMIYHTAMYFGVAYTYNPYRAITGISGLITPYSESSAQIKYTGLTTPAGTFRACNVSIQGTPITSAGITAGYYNPYTMALPLYTNYEARQRSNLDWMTHRETEILSHYLMTAGSRDGVSPLKEEDIAFSTQEEPVEMKGFVPLCDLRTPGDYEHPMNLALDTTNKGSKYLYLYLNKNAGARVADAEEKRDSKGKITQKRKAVSLTNQYKAKKYVAAVFCGVGRTPEAAIADLYSNAKTQWASVSAAHDDISCRPMVTEFDEIIPVDLSSEHPWYTLNTNSTDVKSLPNGKWSRGNLMSYYRWYGHDYSDSSIDDYEKDFKCAYIGVVRTAKKTNTVYGVLKYYTDEKTASDTLNTGSTKNILAGGPVKSPEGNYFLYYSTNTGTANYQAPVTGIQIDKEIFINGYNTAFTVSESDRVKNELPQYGKLRMRTDEYKYIHLGYDKSELKYYEKLYIGVGNTKEEAYSDMVGTTNAYAAIDVDCNYNTGSDKWIAIGYRRTNIKKNAIRDIFLYQGDNPPAEVRIGEGYMLKADEEEDEEEEDEEEEETDDTDNPGEIFQTFEDSKVTGVPYTLLKHNLKSGAEVVSLNEGNGKDCGLYLYYTSSKFFRDKAVETEVTPITNICFTYGDISPRYATASDLAAVFEHSYYGAKTFDASAYESPIWECVLGVEGSPENWKLTGEGASRFSLNSGVLPGVDGKTWAASDNRVYMYTDRADSSDDAVTYQIRPNGELPEFGYYSPTETFGVIKQAG